MSLKISELKKGSHIHIMGICGTAMGNFSGLLKSMGFKISGSDQNVYPPMSDVLESLGVKIMQGYKKENLIPRPDFVIVGNVISRTMEEAQALLASDIPYASFPESMGEMILKNTHSIVVCGTHGKTTTTSMQAWIAHEVGIDSGYLIGGVPKNFKSSFNKGAGEFFVIEGDEYDTAFFDKVPKFKYYYPQSVILTSIEFDHADIYNDLNDVLEAFKILFEKIASGGNFIYHSEDKNIKKLLPLLKTQNLKSYGFSDADFLIKNVKYENNKTKWDVHFGHEKSGSKMISLESSMSGQHNILNFTANFALCVQLGWDLEKVKQAISSFEGVKRRQEILGEFGGRLLVEDFAHHPTAVKLTLEGLKQKYKGRRLVAVFEPRSATSRRSVFQQDYFTAFHKNAELTIIVNAFKSSTNHKSGDEFSSSLLVKQLTEKNNKAFLAETYDDVIPLLSQNTSSEDVIVLMSNGGFGGIYSKIQSSLTSSK